MSRTPDKSILKSRPVFTGLMPMSSTLYGFNRRNNTIANNGSDENALVPFDATMIEPVLEILTACPTGEYALRIFQQHAKLGTCWNDALFMLLFESDVLKPAMRPIIQRLLELNAEQGSLTFGTVGTSDVKLHNFAQTLRTEFAPSIELAIWEFLIVNMQRYVQLAYMFMTDPSVKINIPKKDVKNTRLHNRRKSIQHNTYSKFHKFMKPLVCGLSYGSYSISSLEEPLNNLLELLTEDKYTLIHRPPSDPSTIMGYYFVKFQHVISLFKCNSIWFVYDNDIGCLPFPADDSAKIDTKGIKNFGREYPPGECIYTFVLNDDEHIAISFDYGGEPPYNMMYGSNLITTIKYRLKFPITDPLDNSSIYLVTKPTGGEVAEAALTPRIVSRGMALTPVASGSNNNQDGGRRRRKTHRKRRHARSVSSSRKIKYIINVNK